MCVGVTSNTSSETLMITLFAATPPHPQELLAVREIRRYIFCSTGVLSNISLRGCGDAILDLSLIHISEPTRPY